MKKRLLGAVLAGILVVQSVIPTFAAVTGTWLLGDETYVKTDNHLKYQNYPCWIWCQGYCYYYQTPGLYLKNTTTPDGYTVDELGRWTENGAPVHNGFGNVKMGTDEYLGKSDDEIWSIMRGKLINTFENAMVQGDYDGPDADGKQVHFDNYTYGYNNDYVWYDYYVSTYGREKNVWHNYQGTYLTATLGGSWSDMVGDVNSAVAKAYYAQMPDLVEKEIKIVVGDKIGQELFDYIKPHADKKHSGYIPFYDENGNPVKGRYEFDENWNDVFIEDPNGWQEKAIWVENGSGNGIDGSKIDLSMWKNRTTDYGKRFDVEPYGNALKIVVYN